MKIRDMHGGKNQVFCNLCLGGTHEGFAYSKGDDTSTFKRYVEKCLLAKGAKGSGQTQLQLTSAGPAAFRYTDEQHRRKLVKYIICTESSIIRVEHEKFRKYVR